MVNLLYSLASNRPTQFGIFKNYAAEDVDELLSHYEQDLKDAVVDGHLDGDHLTRLVQTLYLFKSGEFEGIYRRIEKRAVALNTEGKLSVHNCTNILRSFSHGQSNRMAGSDKTYFAFESTVLKGLDKLSDRDVSHLMYAYSVRAVGNPELHKAFEKRLDAMASNLDYPSLFNAMYYMLFTEN